MKKNTALVFFAKAIPFQFFNWMYLTSRRHTLRYIENPLFYLFYVERN